VDRGWTVQVIATPAALEFFDQATIEQLTGSPVRSQSSKPGSPRSRIPDAIIVAPATYNTVNKWAQGTSDTYALGILAEMTGMDTPIVVLPFVNSALANRVAFRRSVETLRSEGVHVILGPGGFEPHPPRTGAGRTEAFPWHLALDEADRLVLRIVRHERPATLAVSLCCRYTHSLGDSTALRLAPGCSLWRLASRMVADGLRYGARYPDVLTGQSPDLATAGAVSGRLAFRVGGCRRDVPV
jgi:hypothetical protein